MKHISILLHIYQPPNQDPDIVRLVDAECYRPISALLESTGARVTVNMNYSLTEQLAVISPSTPEILGAAGGVEFCTSGAYHPILPLVPEAEAERQIELNNRGNGRLLRRWAPSGVFPPEMAFSSRLASLFARMGYLWTVTDDLPWVSAGGEAPFDWIPSCGGLSVFLRSNFWSNRIAFHGIDGALTATEIREGLAAWSGERDAYLVIALDGETFGHHRKGAVDGFLRPFLESAGRMPGVRLTTLGELRGIFPAKPVDIPDGSWSTSPADMARGVPWPLWNDPAVADHGALRALSSSVLAWARECRGDDVATLADRMLYSCPFWWASPGRENPAQVRRGVLSMIETALAAFRETGDRQRMDGVMALAGAVPSMCREV